MKGDLHVRFCEKFEVKSLLLTRLRGESKSPLLDHSPAYGSLLLTQHAGCAASRGRK